MPAVHDLNDLNQIPLFRGLTQSELTRLNQLLRSQTFALGETIIAASDMDESSNENAHGVTYIIRQGIVKVYIEEPLDAKPVVLAILGPGQIIGEMSLVSKVGYSATVIALEKTSLFWIEHAVLRECLRTMPDLAYNLIGILSDRMRLANAQIQSLATMTVRKRVACQILGLVKEYGQGTDGGYKRIPISLTINDLAELVGATAVRVYQVIAELKAYIQVDCQHHITVLDPVGLASVIKRTGQCTRDRSGIALNSNEKA